MTQQQLITQLVGTKELDLVVTIKDTTESKITAKFIALTFESFGQVAMKLEISTTNKDVMLTYQGEATSMKPIVTSTIIRADENTQIPVVNLLGEVILDDDNNPLTIPENVYWKYLAWEDALPYSFKILIENAIKVKFNMIPNNIMLSIDPLLFP